ncbi:MAG: hypothetical protein QGF62_05110, partial [Gammaproteobacteria bacterium]|nr:hypothetical protein [Gammaproteobacteria bacterium]
MKILSKLTSISASALLLISTTQVFAQQTSTLSDLLDLVENDRVAESEDYLARVQDFEQNASRQEEILQTTLERVTEQENLGTQLSDTFEANEIIIR